MSTNFAGVVDEVRGLSFEERRELLSVIERSLADERRDQILNNGEEARSAFSNGVLKTYSDVDNLIESLND